MLVVVPISESPELGLAIKAASCSYSDWEATLIVMVPRPLRLSAEPSARNWAVVRTIPELMTTFRPSGTEVRRLRSTVPAFTSRVVKPLITLPLLSTTVSAASAKSNTKVSPVALRSLVSSVRLR